MKIAVMGTGMVGKALATKLASLGHSVMMGARAADNAGARQWAAAHGAKNAEFATAAAFAEAVLFAVNGGNLLAAAAAAGTALDDKLVIDVTNPLDMSAGGVPALIPALSNTTSAAEELQKAHPRARVVKTLNTVNCAVMVDPTRVPGEHDIFLCGNDLSAKQEVTRLLQSFGWRSPIDLGGLEAARGMEGMMPLWMRLWQVLGTADFNYKVAR